MDVTVRTFRLHHNRNTAPKGMSRNVIDMFPTVWLWEVMRQVCILLFQVKSLWSFTILDVVSSSFKTLSMEVFFLIRQAERISLSLARFASLIKAHALITTKTEENVNIVLLLP